MKPFSKTLLLLSLFFAIYAYSTAQDLEWAYGLNQGWVFPNFVETDPAGNIITGGQFNGQSATDFDPGPGISYLPQNPGSSIFFQKSDPQGNLIWAKDFGGFGYMRGMAVDEIGNIYIAVEYFDTLDADPGPGVSNLIQAYAIGGNSSCIIKLDPNGNLVWSKVLLSYNKGGFAMVQPNGLVYDSGGDLFFAGFYIDSVDFDPGPGQLFNMTNGYFGGYVQKWDTAGNMLWTVFPECTYDVSYTGLAPNLSGGVVLKGTFGDTLDLDPGPGSSLLTQSGTGFYGFVQNLDGNGNLLWGNKIPASQLLPSAPWPIKVDAQKNVLVGGSFSGTEDFDPGVSTYNISSNGGNDVYLVELDSLGNLVRATTFGGKYSEGLNDFGFDSLGNIYLAGDFSLKTNLDPGIGSFGLNSVGQKDGYIMMLDSGRNLVWGKQIGGSGWGGRCLSIEVDPSGDIIFGGVYQDTVDLDPGPGILLVSNLNPSTMFLARWSQDSCMGFALLLDSLVAPTCTGPGLGRGHIISGTSPISYSWNTSPPTPDSITAFNLGGIYTLTATDSNNCVRQVSAITNTIPFFTNFDLNGNFVSSFFRPGLSTLHWLDIFNDGCVSQNGEVRFVLDSLVSLDSAGIVPDTILGDTLVWYFDSISYDSAHLIIPLHLSTDTSATLGQDVCFDLTISPVAGDAVPGNNTKQYCFPVTSSFDPNDKQVYPQGACDDAYVLRNEPLTYTIRFQNTGNAEAYNVHIHDSLPSELDLNSLHVVGKSHAPMWTELLPGNVLNFRFDNIYLPDSSSDPAGSMGYVIFKIFPKASTPSQSLVENKAAIYFDFNEPIITSEVSNTLVDSIPLPAVSITQIQDTLVATASVGSLQWIDCTTNQPIGGATQSTFVPQQTGNYQVLVQDGGCETLSACYPFTSTGLETQDALQVRVFPNPNSGSFSIFLRQPKKPYTLKITDIRGKLIWEKDEVVEKTFHPKLQLQPGLFFLTIKLESQQKTFKILVK